MSFSSKTLQYCFLQDGAGRNESESDLSVDEYSHEENNVSDSSAEINFSEESESDSDSFIGCSEDAVIDSAVSQGDQLFQHSPVTVEEAVISLCDVFVKNRLTKTALSDMLKFCKSLFCPKTAACQVTCVSSSILLKATLRQFKKYCICTVQGVLHIKSRRMMIV